ncbi:protein CNPPD1 [Vanessa cardui]|uniref:protein CNPPD1 n=1 Tax=Vanessa cardui TaxID=171605 RepID=UPI001F141FC2|nr:protein CNPPD1 [Vanessa cardui]XP_046964509.1 protein CNPPD1 [Vanessa cardui]
MSNVSKRRKEGSRAKIKSMGDHKEFLKRISKTLYYGQLPTLPCLSLPVTEISCELWSVPQRGRSLRRLHADAAADIARSACVSPCALVLAILYLERLKRCNPDYLSAAAPADLFLVSLMVSNKFLQDDGEDDEVICSEWAVSGGLELDQLKKLEVEFLNAIDWNVFVSEKSFEDGLLWLERQVALRQAQLRGFFTYSDLAVACSTSLLSELAQSVSTACLGVTLSYVSSLLTLVTSTLVISHAWLPAMQTLAARGSSVALDANLDHSFRSDLESRLSNATVDLHTYGLPDESPTTYNLRCCDEWFKYQKESSPKKTWYDGVVAYDWKSFETWWSKTSVLNWLYQSSLINPMQRWLEKMNQFIDFFKKEMDFDKSHTSSGRCNPDAKLSEARCVRQWLNLSKLSVFVASMSDR